MASPPGDPQDPMQWLLCSSVGSDRRVLIPPLSMLTVPYQRPHNRPFHTAEDDFVCAGDPSSCQYCISVPKCVEDVKTQISHPTPNPKRNKRKQGKRGKNKNEKTKTPLWGPLCKLCAVPFYFKISWQMTKTNS